MSDWNKLNQTLNLLTVIAENTTGGGGGGSTASDITHLGGQVIALNQGTANGGTLRIVTAENDMAINKRNSTFYTYDMCGGYSREIVNAAYIPFAAGSLDLLSTNPLAFKPAFDDLHIIVGDSMHDDQAGDSANSVLFEYYDNNNAFQSVTEPLGANTTFTGVRRVVTFEVNAWGATNKYNYSNISLTDMGGTLIAIIPEFFNKFQKFQQEIPLNGKLYLDRLVATQLDSQFTAQWINLRIVVRTYDGTDTIDQIIFACGVPNQSSINMDLSNLPVIHGPADYSINNMSVMVVGETEGGEGHNTIGSAHISYFMG